MIKDGAEAQGTHELLQTALGHESFTAFVTFFALDRFVEPARQTDTSSDSSLFSISNNSDFLDRVERVSGLNLEEDELVERGLKNRFCLAMWAERVAVEDFGRTGMMLVGFETGTFGRSGFLSSASSTG